MLSFSQIHQEIKTIRKNNNLKKSIPVTFAIHGGMGIEYIAIVEAEAFERDMSEYGKLYQGKAILFREQDENPYENPTYKEINKSFKEVAKFSPEQFYKDGWLIVEALCKDIHIATEVTYDEKFNKIIVWTIPLYIAQEEGEN